MSETRSTLGIASATRRPRPHNGLRRIGLALSRRSYQFEPGKQCAPSTGIDEAQELKTVDNDRQKHRSDRPEPSQSPTPWTRARARRRVARLAVARILDGRDVQSALAVLHELARRSAPRGAA